MVVGMGEIEMAQPKPAPRFKVGDTVTSGFLRRNGTPSRTVEVVSWQQALPGGGYSFWRVAVARSTPPPD